MFDTGSNLTSTRFHKDLDAVLARAHSAGVVAQLITGTSVAASRDALALATRHAGLFATAGIHPHEASSCDSDALQQIEYLARHPRVLAIGETGLDFNRDFSPRADQERAFAWQLDLAARLSKPAFLHQRDAHARFLPLLKAQRSRLKNAVVHCFTGTRAELFDYLDLDCYIGITGWVCDRKRGAELRELVALIPAQRLLIETDAPYLLPHNLTTPPTEKGRNEPAYLPWVLREIAQCRRQDAAELAQLTFANTCEFLELTTALVPRFSTSPLAH